MEREAREGLKEGGQRTSFLPSWLDGYCISTVPLKTQTSLAEYGLWVLLNLGCCQGRRGGVKKEGENESVSSAPGKGGGGERSSCCESENGLNGTHFPPLLDLPDLVVKKRLLGRVREYCHRCELCRVEVGLGGKGRVRIRSASCFMLTAGQSRNATLAPFPLAPGA